MTNFFKHASLAAVLFLVASGCNKDDDDQQNPPSEAKPEVVLAAGDSLAVISKINSFREGAGTPLNTTPGAKGGRREINWDGVGAEFLSPLAFPAEFFNSKEQTAPDGRKRGLVYFPAQAALLVSDKNFTEIDTAFKGQFKAFSKNKLFSAKGTNVSELRFELPGLKTPAYVTSFGVIFSDVDHAESTFLELYDGQQLIAKIRAQVADKQYSFVGFHAPGYKVTRIRITAGSAALAKGSVDRAANDLVVIDDFIYNEPKAY
jgi:hypothetical protein